MRYRRDAQHYPCSASPMACLLLRSVGLHRRVVEAVERVAGDDASGKHFHLRAALAFGPLRPKPAQRHTHQDCPTRVDIEDEKTGGKEDAQLALGSAEELH